MFLFQRIPYKPIIPILDEIDVVIPITKKDLAVLPLCLEGVRTKVSNRIKDIYIVAAPSEEIKNVCDAYRCKFVDENTVLGFKPSDLNLIIAGGLDRSGWLFQQFIKLSGALGTCENYLCIDADHILINPHTFLSKDGKPVFYMSLDNHQPYFDMISRVSTVLRHSLLSYVSHKMLFNKHHVMNLQRDIEKQTGEIWYRGVLDNYDKNEVSGFSEFELYGNYIDDKIKRPWKQKALKKNEMSNFTDLCRRYGNKYNSLTIPDYAKNYI